MPSDSLSFENPHPGNDQAFATNGPSQTIPPGPSQQPPTDPHIPQSAHTSSYNLGNQSAQNIPPDPSQQPPAGPHMPQSAHTRNYNYKGLDHQKPFLQVLLSVHRLVLTSPNQNILEVTIQNGEGFSAGGPTYNSYTAPSQQPPTGNPRNQNTNHSGEGDSEDTRRYETEVAIWDEVQPHYQWLFLTQTLFGQNPVVDRS